MVRLFRDARGRVPSPFLALGGLVSHLNSCADLFTAVGTAEVDERWSEVAAALYEAAKVLRRVQLRITAA